MDEGTIYNPQSGQENTQQNPAPTVPAQPVQQVVTPTPPSPAIVQPQTFGPNPSNPPPPPAPKSSFSKKIIKIVIGVFAVFIIVALVLFIVSKLSNQQKKSSGPVTLTYWGLVDKSKIATAISGFEKANPEVKINYIQEDPSDYVEKLKVRIPNGNGPDVYMLNNSWLPVLSDFLLPLPQSVIDQNKFDNDYYPVAKTDLIKDGAVYAVPLSADTQALFINTALLPAGRENSALGTWQEFVELAQSATKRDDQGKITVAGAGIGTFDNVKDTQYLLSLLFAQNGVDFAKVSDYQERISQALTFYTDFAQVENSVWDDNQDNSLLAFAQGKSAMYFGFIKDIESIKTQKPDLSFRVAPVPQLTPENPICIANYFAQGISSGTTHQEEALLFMKYLITHPSDIGQLSADKNFSGVTDANISVFQKQMSFAVSMPFAADSSEKSFNAKLVSSLRENINLLLGGGSAEDAAGQIIEDYSSIISSLQNSSSK